ncbi:DNA cytosine methyltransferase [Nocardia panacis]|uniref:DNA (cytosine-5-)-methyltransferase n=1 Tax=Nocardia panacis TaxID=2340916 RepID=A0A3A4KBS9_9NOCA|nr:DNA cytosine methyltransferase [Nocardia panacis]RJO79317.1 DNA cytosine methyltransferase [Nocardia panacis]
MLRIGSLCSGYLGLDMAVETIFADTELVWVADIDRNAIKLLGHRAPNIPNLGDVKQIDWNAVPPIDILTAGYPCQPFSTSGRRKGENDPRHLWPYIYQAIRVLRPRITLLENVAGHRSKGFDTVLGDLAEIGLSAQWVSVRASDVGAPHRRERVFIAITDPACGFAEWKRAGPESPIADSSGIGGGRRGEPDSGSCSTGSPNSTDRRGENAWGEFLPAVQEWERRTRPAPWIAEPNRNGQPRLSPRFVEWMMGLPAGWVTAPELGLPYYGQLHLLGNGVIPPQAAHAIALLLDMIAIGSTENPCG